MPSVLVPPRRDRAGVSRLIRSVPCSVRCTGRPRPIPDVGSSRCMTRSARSDVLWRAWVAVRRNDGAPGVDKITLAAVEEYAVTRLLDEPSSRPCGRCGVGADIDRGVLGDQDGVEDADHFPAGQVGGLAGRRALPLGR